VKGRLLGFGLYDIGDSQISESDGVSLGIRYLFADLFWYEEVKFFELFLRLVLLHIK
jgi:hypothetical protein